MTSVILILQNFIDNVKKDFNINTKFNIKIKLIETIEIIKNPDQCLALVCNNTNNGKNKEEYQCTRKKRFGMFCGLHHNRKSEFVPIQKHIETLETNYYVSG
jgi:hypothetical protein